MPSAETPPGSAESSIASAARVAVCADFGSTFTKALLVDLDRGQVLGTASRPTTIGTDVLEGYGACLTDLAVVDGRATSAPVYACSSAGGGLR